jgi:[acyl-carrier-protein] S-malonyltransferase
MLADIIEAHPAVGRTLDEAGEAMSFDLRSAVLEGPAELLNRTDITQPALLAASVAIWRRLEEAGAAPVAMAGHSLGEYSALVAAGALGFADAVRLVHLRGQLMQQAVPLGEGAMAAILGLEDDAIASACDATEGVVTPANFNAPGQVVIAGTREAVERAAEACKAAGAKRAVLLDVSVPSHCALMAGISDAFAQKLAEIPLQMPRVAVVQNVDGATSTDVDRMRAKLVAQLASPVRWTDCVAALLQTGVSQIIECGPGNVLSGLIKRIDRSLTSQPTGTLAGFDAAVGQLQAGADA